MIISGLSGNEMYCLNLLGLKPGNFLVGNSVYSMGVLGSVKAAVRTAVGGEIKSVTDLISEGRRLAQERLDKELEKHQGVGATGTSSELIIHGSNIEFLSTASAVHSDQTGTRKFTSSSDGQELFCQMDAGYSPLHFVFGNTAYSIGIGRGILGSLRSLGRGEVKEFTDIFNTTRHLAYTRMVDEAKAAGANSVVGVETSILPLSRAAVHEMLMLGTASKHSLPVSGLPEVITSDLRCEEMWNLAVQGYVPIKMIFQTSVYSLGIIGGITSFLKSLVKGEVSQLTNMIYEARESVINKLHEEATRLGADGVMGMKTHIYQLGGGLIEFFAIGTAVKHVGDGVKPKSPQLPPQAIIVDQDTFYNTSDQEVGVRLNNSDRNGARGKSGRGVLEVIIDLCTK